MNWIRNILRRREEAYIEVLEDELEHLRRRVKTLEGMYDGSMRDRKILSNRISEQRKVIKRYELG